jgi:YVTN family beta-propeller protein
MLKLRSLALAACTLAILAPMLLAAYSVFPRGLPPGFGPTSSSPIALTHDDRFVWTLNRDNNTVSVIEVAGDLNLKRAEVSVGAEPRTIAITPNDAKAYVTNMAAGTVSVINTALRKQTRVIRVGTEPFGCALTPDGAKLYVTNFTSDSVSVIDTTTDAVVRTIQVGPKPRGIAINSDGTVYVTQFLAQLRAGGVEGADDGKEGRVTVINSATDTVTGTVVLNPLADTGFKAAGDALGRIPPGASFTFTTGAFPNLLQSVVLRGDRAYLPNTASSPNGPVRFNVNVQAFLSVFNTSTNTDSGQTINMNRGIQFEPASVSLFLTNPIAIAFKHAGDEGYAVSAATDRLVRVQLDGTGAPTINAPQSAGDPDNVVRVQVGKNPQGIVINSTDTRAYVLNYISRDMSVVDIANGSATKNLEIKRITSAAQPAPGTLSATLHRGNELFNTAIGPAGTVPESQAPAGRMSNRGWGTCYSCHPDGLSDGVTWIFGDGPRQTISMESTAEHPQPPTAQLNANGAPILPSFKQRVLNWSAVRDEVQDFELNIRGVSGGQGLITDGQPVVNLTPTANTGRSADLDAIAAYVTMGIRSPVSPTRSTNVGGGFFDPDVLSGRALFTAGNCQQCHGGPNWTDSRVRFAPPPSPALITNNQIAYALRQVGTFNPAAFNEVTANGGPPLGNDGFNMPSLINVYATAPYLHNGSAPTLDGVLSNVTHRSAGTGGVDTLTNPTDRAFIVKFLKTIDSKTTTFP